MSKRCSGAWQALEVAGASATLPTLQSDEEREDRLSVFVNYAEMHGREAAAEGWPYFTRAF